MPAALARFSDTLPGVGGKQVLLEGSRLVLEGTSSALSPAQLVAMVQEGKAVWLNAAAGEKLERAYGQIPVQPPAVLPLAVPSGASPEPSADKPRRGHNRRALSRSLVVALVALAALVAGAAAGWVLRPVLLPVRPAAVAEVPATAPGPGLPSAVPEPSVPATAGGDDATFTAGPETVPASDTVPASVEGYIKGYDPKARAGVLLVYKESGDSVPMAYDSKSGFQLGGKAVPISEFVKATAQVAGKPVRVSSFVVEPIESAVAILGSAAASIPVDPKGIRLYLVRATAK